MQPCRIFWLDDCNSVSQNSQKYLDSITPRFYKRDAEYKVLEAQNKQGGSDVRPEQHRVFCMVFFSESPPDEPMSIPKLLVFCPTSGHGQDYTTGHVYSSLNISN